MKRKPTIWYVCKYASAGKYGFETRHFGLAAEWAVQGHDVVVISSNSSHLIRTLPRFLGPYLDEWVDGVRY